MQDPYKQMLISELDRIGKRFEMSSRDFNINLYNRKNLIRSELNKALKETDENDFLIKLPPYAMILEKRNQKPILFFSTDIPQMIVEGFLAHELSDYSLGKNLLLKPLIYLRSLICLTSRYYPSDILDKLAGSFVDKLANLKAKQKGFRQAIERLNMYKPKIEEEDRRLVENIIIERRDIGIKRLN